MKFLGAIVLILVSTISHAQLGDTHLRRLNDPLKAMINNESKGANHQWPLYAQREMFEKIGSLKPGDTVTIIGWSTWTCVIELGTHKAYLPWKAVIHTRETEPMLRMIEEESRKDEDWDKNPYPFPPDANLRLTTDKTDIFLGECFNFNLEMCLADKNLVPLKFHKLGLEVMEIYKN